MISEELKTIIDTLGNQGKMFFFEGATDEQIIQFEIDYEIELPKKYKEWLQYSDGGELFLPAGIQLYGVAHKPVINLNEINRTDERYIIIGALASGDSVLCEKSRERISIYDHETGSIDDELIYDDFYSFLSDLYDLLDIRE